MKKIAYLITNNDVDGKGPTQIVSAFWDEAERDRVFENDKNKCYNSKAEMIVNPDEHRKQVISKLNGLDLLVIGWNAV